MLRRLLATFALLLAAAPAGAQCAGVDIMGTLKLGIRHGIEARIDATPYARGNFWRATRGDQVIHLVGTYHLNDPRQDRLIARLAPVIDAAALVLVEAGPEEQAALKAAMASRPELMFIVTGPTLIEQLDPADWQVLAAEMASRGIPGFLAAKMQPWYVSMVLGIPACAMADLQAGAQGLDARVIARAEARGIPLRPLEPYDSLFRIFDAVPQSERIEMIQNALSVSALAEDLNETTRIAYFAEDVRIAWELGRVMSQDRPGKTAAGIDAEMARMEETLINRRNRAWIPVIEAAAAEGPVFAAFGALHLSGEEGMLALLAARGFALERLSF